MNWIIGIVLCVLMGKIVCDDSADIASAFMEAADTFFAETLPRHRRIQDTPTEDTSVSGVLGQVLSGLGNLLVRESINQQGNNNDQGNIDLAMLGPFMQLLGSASDHIKKKPGTQKSNTPEFDFESLFSMANVFMSFKTSKIEGRLPSIIDNLYIAWQNFRNSELGQTVWKNSGLTHILSSMTDEDGRLKYESILESFENSSTRRRWIKSLTTFFASWISYISDPAIQQRYLTTVQFIGNNFLNSQGFPQTTFFDTSQPAESLTRIMNTAAIKYFNTNFDTSKFIKPAALYIQDLIKLASKKGFIMSRVNANELSSHLSNTINNDIVSPLMKTYRAYKWALKEPQCSTHIFCVINEGASYDNAFSLQKGVIKITSFSAALALSHKTGVSFKTLYDAIQESSNCFMKYPAGCNDFHIEEVRATTEVTHSEL